MEEPAFRGAVVATGRQKLIMAGLWTEVCLVFPALDLLNEGYQVYAVSDASAELVPTPTSAVCSG